MATDREILYAHVIDESIHTPATSLSNYVTRTELNSTILTDYVLSDDYTTAMLTVNDLIAARVTTDYLTANYVTTTYLEANYIGANAIAAVYATIDELETNYATIQHLEATYMTSQHIETTFLSAQTAALTYATIANLDTERAEIDLLLVDYIKATDIVADNVSVDTILGNVAKFLTNITFTTLANDIIAYNITSQHMTIEDGFIKSAMIGELDCTNIVVSNLKADSIVVNKINGQTVANTPLSTVLDQTTTTVSNIEAQKMYRIEIVSSNGNIFKNGEGSTVLSAVVYSWDDNITDDLTAEYFRWTRVSADTIADTVWNNNHFSGSKTITVTGADVIAKATFCCDLIDPATGLSLLS